MSSTKKKDFNWEKGGVLDEESFDPVGDVRVAGLPKLKKATHADPERRKKERDQVLLTKQSQPYQATSDKILPGDDGVIADESQSGLSEKYESSKAKKLIEHGSKIKGLDRFGKKNEKKK